MKWESTQVELSLWGFDPTVGDYLATGKRAVTDAAGHYQFDDADGVGILPGRYQIRETQPAGYFSVGALRRLGRRRDARHRDRCRYDHCDRPARR